MISFNGDINSLPQSAMNYAQLVKKKKELERQIRNATGKQYMAIFDQLRYLEVQIKNHQKKE